MTEKILIAIPTYNEKENVEPLYSQLKQLGLSNDFLFVDDNSPDGTSEILDRIAQRDPKVHAVRRAGKLGIGSAHMDIIRWAYDRGYDILITMDCDFTHQPEDVPVFLEKSLACDVVIGSRYTNPKSLEGWNPLRKFLTHLAHFLTKTLLQMPYDATGAFRVYRLKKIPQPIFGLVQSKGYSFFFESLYILYLNGYQISEIPIRLPARTYGHSKMSWGDAWASLRLLFQTSLKTRLKRKSFIWSTSNSQTQTVSDGHDQEAEWEEYWSAQEKNKKRMYDVIAVFYRKYIIKPALNHFIKTTFAPGSSILHAGCGAGQVDTDVVRWAKVTALDISPKALERYRALHGDQVTLKHGSIFELPFEDDSFDGIYNLGVMEHFTEEQIQQILHEFHRVLKNEGNIVLFWPPEFGLSVRVLKGVHFVLHRWMKNNTKLHPDEISRVQSQNHVSRILSKAGFEMTGYYFGCRDLFTHAIVIGQKLTPITPSYQTSLEGASRE